jgi:glycogen debranching enzyme
MVSAPQAARALASLAYGAGLYRAGIPGYTSNFSRDSLTYGLLADDVDALRAQLEFSARHQGQQADAVTGEERGKIHHELPGVEQDGLCTTYDACDTTALFLLGIARVARGDEAELLRHFRSSIDLALTYVESHLVDGVFYEDTRQSGADRFALKVTYWKDSELNVPGPERAASYPMAYSLVHFQYAAALRALGRASRSAELLDTASRLTERGIERFWRGDHFAVALRSDGTTVDTPSSDSLHALLFLEPEQISRPDALRIGEYSEQLATRFGYLPARPANADVDPYHSRYVWVHEQALLHLAASRHGLEKQGEVSASVAAAFKSGFPELIDPHDGSTAVGNRTQLWSVGAYLYFRRVATRSRG